MKYFLASVGNAELLEKVDGNYQLFASARTLTDSTLSFTSTMEEVRAGQGAQLYGRFNHDTGMTVQLTDAMFNLDYVAAQVGATVQEEGTSFEHDGSATVESDKITVSKTPKAVGESNGLDKIVIWYKAKSSKNNDVHAYEVVAGTEDGTYVRADGKAFPIVDGVAPNEYCVSYFVKSVAARTAKVASNFNPKELVLILTANLYAGDASHPETGKPVGTISVRIPRFSLDGAFDLSLAMSSAATVSLNGTALVTETNDCENTGIYAEIVEVITGRTNAPASLLLADADKFPKKYDDEDLGVGNEFQFYGVYADGSVEEIDPCDIVYNVGTTGAEIKNGVIYKAPTKMGTITFTYTVDDITVSTTAVLAPLSIDFSQTFKETYTKWNQLKAGVSVAVVDDKSNAIDASYIDFTTDTGAEIEDGKISSDATEAGDITITFKNFKTLTKKQSFTD